MSNMDGKFYFSLQNNILSYLFTKFQIKEKNRKYRSKKRYEQITKKKSYILDNLLIFLKVDTKIFLFNNRYH